MSIFAIGDLHLPFGIKKPMDKFGDKWVNYTYKIEENWRSIVRDKDIVLLPGDISWATYLSQTYDDFKFINNLPGKKIISKGNHDYWWTTKSKLNNYIIENEFNTISFVQNDSYTIDDVKICCTRGWIIPEFEKDATLKDKKIYLRELNRLKLSLEYGENVNTTIVALHYPPIYKNIASTGFSEIMDQYNVDICVYGHLHGSAHTIALEGRINNTDYYLVSSDYLGFKPLKIY